MQISEYYLGSVWMLSKTSQQVPVGCQLDWSKLCSIKKNRQYNAFNSPNIISRKAVLIDKCNEILINFKCLFFSFVSVAVSLFLTLLTVVLYILCHYTRQKGDYETEEAKRATDFEDNISMAFMYSPDGLPIPQRREWFIWKQNLWINHKIINPQNNITVQWSQCYLKSTHQCSKMLDLCQTLLDMVNIYTSTSFLCSILYCIFPILLEISTKILINSNVHIFVLFLFGYIRLLLSQGHIMLMTFCCPYYSFGGPVASEYKWYKTSILYQ